MQGSQLGENPELIQKQGWCDWRWMDILGVSRKRSLCSRPGTAEESDVAGKPDGDRRGSNWASRSERHVTPMVIALGCKVLSLVADCVPVTGEVGRDSRRMLVSNCSSYFSPCYNETTWQNQFKERKVYFQLSVWGYRKVTATGTWGGWSHRTSSQGCRECWMLVYAHPFLFRREP